VGNAVITEAVRKVADLTPQGIITRLRLREPIFRQTAAYGHFGRDDVQFSWEQDDLVADLQKAIG
jgi:S-adenosylmethionine synthetase